MGTTLFFIGICGMSLSILYFTYQMIQLHERYKAIVARHEAVDKKWQEDFAAAKAQIASNLDELETRHNEAMSTLQKASEKIQKRNTELLKKLNERENQS